MPLPKLNYAAGRNREVCTDGVKEEQPDAIIVLHGARLHVHSTLLSAESLYFRELFRNVPAECGTCEVELQYASTHTVWRTLNLIYNQSYTASPAPRISKPDHDCELTRHACVYQLAIYWGLSECLLDIPLANFRDLLHKGWKLEELLLTINTILHPTFPAYPEVFPADKLCDDQMVKLILKTLRKNLERSDHLFIELFLQSSPFKQMIEVSLGWQRRNWL